MVLDTSAIIAILADEPDAAIFRDALIGATSISISAVTVLEARIVLHSRYGESAVRQLDEMLEGSGISDVLAKDRAIRRN
jgi:ribonuclease VapC